MCGQLYCSTRRQPPGDELRGGARRRAPPDQRVGQAVDVGEVDEHGGVTERLGQRAARKRDHRHAGTHRLEGEPEALVDRGVGEHTGAAEQVPAFRVAHVPEPHGAVGVLRRRPAAWNSDAPHPSAPATTSRSSGSLGAIWSKARTSTGRFLRGSTVPVTST